MPRQWLPLPTPPTLSFPPLHKAYSLLCSTKTRLLLSPACRMHVSIFESEAGQARSVGWRHPACQPARGATVHPRPAALAGPGACRAACACALAGLLRWQDLVRAGLHVHVHWQDACARHAACLPTCLFAVPLHCLPSPPAKPHQGRPEPHAGSLTMLPRATPIQNALENAMHDLCFLWGKGGSTTEGMETN
jgi:hypothetical protein